MSSIFKRLTICALFVLSSCGGTGLEGKYQGRIGSKSKVSIRFFNGDEAELKGYWGETLKGSYEKSSLRGQTVDSLVFIGPDDKPFKLRICYKAEEDCIEILSIRSRIFGPGVRYVTTEPKSTFASGNPRLRLLK